MISFIVETYHHVQYQKFLIVAHHIRHCTGYYKPEEAFRLGQKFGELSRKKWENED